MNNSNNIAVIPARFASSRFPGKPLADKTGKPLIQHVVEQTQRARSIASVVVATDDQRIFDAVQAFGSVAVMTRSDHPNGTSRIAEAIAGQPGKQDQIIVNVQGDEPEIDPAVIDQLVEGLHLEGSETSGGAPMATLAADFATDEDPTNPNIVKLVTTMPAPDRHPRALYFSRALIPHDRDETAQTTPLKHPGLYAYRRDFLLKFAKLSPTPLEQTEKLEQLRALEHGYPIAVVKTTVRHHGIDTPEQYDAFVKRYLTENGGPG